MIDLAVHWGLEMLGSGCWGVCRGRCGCRWHRWAGDAALTLVLAVVTLQVVG